MAASAAASAAPQTLSGTTRSESPTYSVCRAPPRQRRISKPRHRRHHHKRAGRAAARGISFCAAECKYECIIDAVHDLGWRIICQRDKDTTKNATPDDSDTVDMCNIYWIDVANIHERMSKLKPWQRINHFPGMNNIARKNRLAQNLEKMRRVFPKEYSFYPRTWVLPLELADFRAQFDSRGKSSRFYIIKPDSGCQGRGIYLTQNIDTVSPFEQLVAQHYIRRPFLIDGFKFDLRLYVLVTSCKPLRMYLFNDGLVRLCTEEYTKPSADNVAVKCMHLTNYAINKHNGRFQVNADVDAGDMGSKRSLKWFMEYIATEKGQAKADALWRQMGAMCVKVVISILPTLVREYEATFFKDTRGQDLWSHSATRQAEVPVIPTEVKPSKTAATDSGASLHAGTDDASSSTADSSASASASSEAGMSSEAGASNDSGKRPQSSETIDGSRCFEILGVDVIIDSALKPWLVEVNHLPSFATDSPLDADVKSRVIEQTLLSIRAKATDRHVYENSERAKATNRLYAPPPPPPVLQSTGTISFATAANFRHRIEAILRKHDPDKLVKVDGWMKKFAGREEKLYRYVEKKCMSSAGNTPSENEAEPSLDSAEGECGDIESSITELPATTGQHRTQAQTTTGTFAHHGLTHQTDSASARGQDVHASDYDDNDDDCSSHGKDVRSSHHMTTSSPQLDSQLEDTYCARRHVAEGDDECTDCDVEREEDRLVDFERIYPISRDSSNRHANLPSYASLIKYVFEHDEKRLKRLSYPLRQHRGSALEFNKGTLPPLAQEQFEATDGRVPWGNPYKRVAVAPCEHKPLPMPGQKQIAAADRLARGFSSAREQSTFERTLVLGASRSTDGPAPCAAEACASRTAVVVAQAKEWRRRLEDAKQRRHVAQVALQPKTYVFADDAPLGDDMASCVATRQCKATAKPEAHPQLRTAQKGTFTMFDIPCHMTPGVFRPFIR